MSDATDERPADTSGQIAPVVVRHQRFTASYDHEFRAKVSFLLDVTQVDAGKWRWQLHDMDSGLGSIPVDSGEQENEVDAKHECRMAVANILRREAEKISDIADRIRDYDEIIEWHRIGR